MKNNNEQYYYTRKVGFWEYVPNNSFTFDEINDRNKVETHVVVRMADGVILSRDEITQEIVDYCGITNPTQTLKEYRNAIIFWITIVLLLLAGIVWSLYKFIVWLF